MLSRKGEIFCMPRKKKKKTQQAETLPKPPVMVCTTSPVPPVALLIDGENVAIPDLIAHVLVEAGSMGGVTVRQVYGNWAAPSMQSWKKYLTHYALEQMGNRPGHNATDIALVIGAMDLFYSGIKHFCLVAGDSDYVPLVSRLRQGGCMVLVIGPAAVSKSLKEVSSRFLSTDQLLPQTLSQLTAMPAIPPSQSSELSALLTQAYHVVAQKSGTEWVLLSQVGITLRKLSSTFETTYGKKHLSALVEQCNGDFEKRMQTIGKGQAEEVRLRPTPP
jgi:hypothetical protein